MERDGGVSGETVQFVGEVSDDQDLPEALTMEWRATPVNPPGPAVMLGTGSMIETDKIVAFGGTVPEYEITVTDSDGLQAQDRMTLYVLDQPIQ